MKKRIFALIAAFAMLTVLCIGAQSVTAPTSGACGEDGDHITWAITEDGGKVTLTLTGEGDMADMTPGNQPYAAWAGVVTDLVIDENIEKIAENCFAGFTALTEVYIPGRMKVDINSFKDCTALEKVTFSNRTKEIRQNVFEGCTSLTTIEIDDSEAKDCKVLEYAFYGLPALETVDLPDNVTKIREYTFAHCRNLKTVDFGDVEEVQEYAFWDCTSLESASFSASLEEIAEYAFYGCTSLETVDISAATATTSINEYSFAMCTSLKSIDLSNINKIKDHAFDGCASLESVVITAAVKDLGVNAFAGCTSLETVTFADTINVTEIPAYAFRDCTSLKTVVLPEGITSIGEYAFDGCTSLESVTGLEDVTNIGNYAFKNCASLESAELNDAILMIPNGAFLGCESLASVSLPSGLRYIGQSAFQDCKALASVELPETLVGINKNAFAGCEALASVIIPKATTYVAEYAFIDSGVRAFVVLSPNTQIGDYAYGRFVNYDSEGIIGGSIVYAADESLAKFYADESGLTLKSIAEAPVTVPEALANSSIEAAASELLAYKLANPDTTNQVYIAGNPLSDYELVYIEMQKSSHKYISDAAKELADNFLNSILSYSIDRKEQGEDELDPAKKQIYISIDHENFYGDDGSMYSYTGVTMPDGRTVKQYLSDTYGIADMGKEDFVIFELNGDLYIHAGGHQGIHYATAEFKESYLGVNYLIGNDEDEATYFEGFDCVEIPAGLFDYQTAIIEDRDAQSQGYIGDDNSDTRIAAYRKLNSWKNRGAFVKDERFGGGTGYIGNAHTMKYWLDEYCGPAYWPTLSPEYDEGENICLSNQQYIDWLAEIAADIELPDIGSSKFDTETLRQAISVSMIDSDLWCTCDECEALVEMYGRSGAVIDFVNKVCDQINNGDWDIETDYIRVWTLAYMSARYAPVDIVPLPNVTVCYTWQGCNNHTACSDECTYTSYNSNNQTERENFEAWNAITDKMYVWMYPVNYTFYMAPSHEIFNLLDDVRYFADQGVFGLYFEDNYGDSEYGDGYSLEGLQAYMQSKVMWDPYMTEAEYVVLMKEYMALVYGPGYESIYECAQLDEAAKDANGCYVNNHDRPYDMYNLDFLAEHFDEMVGLISEAYEAAETDAQRAAIDKYSAHILFMGLSATHEEIWENGDADSKAEYEEQYNLLWTIITEYDMKISAIDTYNAKIPASAEDIDFSKSPAEAWYGTGTNWRDNPLTYAVHVEANDPWCEVEGNIEYWYYGETDTYFADALRQNMISYEDTIIDALEHNPELVDDRKPSCGSAGYTGDYVCTRCSEVLEEGSYITALWHEFKDGECIHCGREEPKATTDTPILYNPFKDISEDDWFYNDVVFVWNKKIMDGISGSEFDPDSPVTREMMATVIWRLAGSPDALVESKFTDVKADQYYTDAVAWAELVGIINGYGDGTYGVGDLITREQMATMLYRYAKFAGIDTTVSGAAKFTDTAKISDWATDAAAWANANGILIGRDTGDFDPAANAKRCELAAVLTRFMTKFN